MALLLDEQIIIIEFRKQSFQYISVVSIVADNIRWNSMVQTGF